MSNTPKMVTIDPTMTIHYAYEVWAKTKGATEIILITTIPGSFLAACTLAEYYMANGSTEVLVKEVKINETSQIDVKVRCNLAVHGWQCRLSKGHSSPCERYDGKTVDQILLPTPVYREERCPNEPIGSDGHIEQCALESGHSGKCMWGRGD